MQFHSQLHPIGNFSTLFVGSLVGNHKPVCRKAGQKLKRNRNMLFRSVNIGKLTDLEVIARYRKTGNNDCVGELYKRYSTLVFGVSLKYLKDEAEAQDAVISIFEKLMDDLHKHTISNFKSWLHSVTRNHCLMALREKQSKQRKVVQFQAENTVNGHQPIDAEREEKHLKETQLSELEEAIKQLNEEQRTCIELFFLQQKCYQEVAELSGYTMKQVKSYIQNGKRNLKNILVKRNASIFT